MSSRLVVHVVLVGICLLSAVLLSPTAQAELLVNIDPERPPDYRGLLDILGVSKQTVREYVAPPMPPKLAALLADLASEDWVRKAAALRTLGLDRVVRSWQTLQSLFELSKFRPCVLARNYDADPATEYLLLLHWSGNFPPYLVYIDERLGRAPLEIYETAGMYSWFLIVRDVNGDGIDELVLFAHQQIGTGVGYDVLVIFNMRDGQLNELARITLGFQEADNVYNYPVWETLADRFDWASFRPGNLRDFAIERTYFARKRLRQWGGKLDGGWRMALSQHIRWRWDEAQKRYMQQRQPPKVIVHKNELSVEQTPDALPWFKAMEQRAERWAVRTYRRVP